MAFSKNSFNLLILLFSLNLIFASNVLAQQDDINLKFLIAVYNNDYEEVDSTLKKGADINFQTVQGATCLHYAVNNKNWFMVEKLLNYGADIEKKDNNGLTPLLLACYTGIDTIINVLIQHSADYSVRDTNSLGAIHYAVFSGSLVALDMLLFYGADFQQGDNKGITPLMYAIEMNDYEMVKILVKEGADINLSDKSGNNALFYAVYKNNRQILEFLYNENIDIFQKNIEGVNIYELSILLGNIEISKFLKPFFESKKYDINERLLWEQYFRNRDRVLKKNLKSYDVSRPKQFYVMGITNRFILLINTEQILFANNLYINELNYLVKFGLGYGSGFSRNAERVSINEKKYQLHAYRYFFSVNVEKSFGIYSNSINKKWVNFVFGATMPLMFVTYRGMNFKPRAQLFVVPSFGLEYKVKNISYYTGYQYWDYSSENVSPQKLVLGVSLSFISKHVKK